MWVLRHQRDASGLASAAALTRPSPIATHQPITHTQDLQALLGRELELHRQIHSAIWAAVAAMERWSSGVARYHSKVTRETNDWLARNAALLAARSQDAVAGISSGGFEPVPVPPDLDLSRSLRPARPPLAASAQQQLQLSAATGEFGAAVVVTAAPASKGGPVRAEPGLAAAAGGPGGAGRTSRPSVELPEESCDDSGAATARRALSSGQPGSSSSSLVRSPGGVSLHARTPAAGLQQQQQQQHRHLAAAGEGGASTPPAPHGRPWSATRNQVVP